MASDRVRICEMAPRDGMQVLNQNGSIPQAPRVDLVNILLEANLEYVEVASFVSPGVESMRDSDQILRAAVNQRTSGTDHQELAVLVANSRHADRLFSFDASPTTIALFTSASEEYSVRNKRKSVSDDLDDYEYVAKAATERGFKVRAHVSCAFRSLDAAGGPGFETDRELLDSVISRLRQMGCFEISLADTDGRAFPAEIERTLDVAKQSIGIDGIGVHLHDRFGQGLVNAYRAWQLGVRSFDSAVAGIGGNRAVIDSVGNIATEKLVLLFESLGVETGVKLPQLQRAITAVHSIARSIGNPAQFGDLPTSDVSQTEQAASSPQSTGTSSSETTGLLANSGNLSSSEQLSKFLRGMPSSTDLGSATHPEEDTPPGSSDPIAESGYSTASERDIELARVAAILQASR